MKTDPKPAKSSVETMKGQAFDVAIPEFVILFRVHLRIPMLAAQDSTDVAEPFEQLIAISISGMCQQFQVPNHALPALPAEPPHSFGLTVPPPARSPARAGGRFAKPTAPD